MAKIAEVTAVYEDDVLALLTRLGLLEAYETGTLRCSVCGASLIEHQLGAVRRATDGEYVLSCGRLDCLDEFSAT
jgi:hypothetical protein